MRILVFFFRLNTAYEMRISDWSSDVCSSDLLPVPRQEFVDPVDRMAADTLDHVGEPGFGLHAVQAACFGKRVKQRRGISAFGGPDEHPVAAPQSNAAQGIFRSEEHTSELQSLMRISYAVLCLKKKTNT